MTIILKMKLINKIFLGGFLPMDLFKRSLLNISVPKTASRRFYFNVDNMHAWTVSSFGSLDNLQLLDTIPLPEVRHHKSLIVKVQASSVNPIDVAMVGGYGHNLLNVMRECNNFITDVEEPKSNNLIPGRDFVGEVMAKGSDVREDIKIGDLVYGVVEAHRQGCHADIVAANDSMVRHIPKGISPLEAAGFLYCGLTAWSALCITGDLYWTSREGKKALIIGGSGGVGSLAIQMLKAWNLQVVATCRTDAIPLLEELKPDVIIDYTAADAMKNIKQCGKYDIILDAAGNVTHYTYIPFLKDWSNSKYVTLRSPLLANTDKYGLTAGMIKNVTDLIKCNMLSGAPQRGATVRWAYFFPVESGVDELHSLLSQNKIKPIVNEVFSFNELPKAYEKVKTGHNRGKVIICMDELIK